MSVQFRVLQGTSEVVFKRTNARDARRLRSGLARRAQFRRFLYHYLIRNKLP